MLAGKKEAEVEMWTQMGLHIIKPSPNGSENSYDGNIARRAFANVTLLSSIFIVDETLSKNLHFTLIVISCEFQANAIKFKQFC